MKKYGLGGAIKRRASQMRDNKANVLSKREKTVDASGKTKSGGLLGQNKTKRYVSNAFGEGKDATVKTKKRFGRTVETTRSASGKTKTVTKKDGTLTKSKRKGDAELTKKKMEGGGKVVLKKRKKKYNVVNSVKEVVQAKTRADRRQDRRAARSAKDQGMRPSHPSATSSFKKSPAKPTRIVMKNGGRVVAQGADKDDLRAERKQERKENRAAKAVKRADRKRRNKGYRQLKKDIKSGKINPYADNPFTGAAKGLVKGVAETVGRAAASQKKKKG